MRTVRARAPLRLGIAGGGTDVSPYCDIHGGYVLNGTIDRYAYAVIKPTNDQKVHFLATDLEQSVSEPLQAEYALSGDLVLHKALYNHIVRHFNGGVPISMELSTFCDAPPGSGLGSSSTLVIAMIKAFAEFLNLPLDDYQIAQIAIQVERIDCGMQGGRQDQYSATFGGFNFMEFYADERAIVNPLRIRERVVCELEASIVLFYSGLSRDSSRIIADQSSNVADRNEAAIEAMHGIKREAITMKECLLKGDLEGMMDSMVAGWESKKNSAATVTNDHIERIFDTALAAGARAGKVSGAGGGGFIMFFVPSEHRMHLIRTLKQYDGFTSNCHFTTSGAQAWKVG